MIITWYGQTCFKIGVQGNKNGKNGGPIELIINPFEKEIGLRPPRVNENNIVLFSQPGKSLTGIFLINGPGEYDIKGIYIQGIEGLTKDKKRTTIYVIEAEDIKLCHLGFLGQKELTAKEIEEIGEIDVLMIPVGGKDTLEAKEAIGIMSQLEPKITIPMYYQVPGLKIHPVKSAKAGVSLKAEQFNRVKLDGLDKFLRVLGIKTPLPLPKLSIKKKDLPDDEAKIVVLQP